MKSCSLSSRTQTTNGGMSLRNMETHNNPRGRGRCSWEQMKRGYGVRNQDKEIIANTCFVCVLL